MESSARESYLVTEIMTATPQKLQLLLIETAMRAAERAKQKWHAGENELACEALIHAQEVVGELLAALDQEQQPALVRRVAAVYLFVFRCLMEANFRRDPAKVDEALKVLRIERETWQQLGGQRAGSAAAAAPVRLPELLPGTGSLDDLPSAGLSLEA